MAILGCGTKKLSQYKIFAAAAWQRAVPNNAVWVLEMLVLLSAKDRY